MTSYTLPGLYLTREAEKIKNKLQGKTYMKFNVEYGGVAGNNSVIIMTEEKVSKKALYEMIIAYIASSM